MLYLMNEDGSVQNIYGTRASADWKPGHRIEYEEINDAGVSTVFLGVDHGFAGGPPVLWETMIFGGTHDQYQERYTSLAAAKEGHKRAVKLVKENKDD